MVNAARCKILRLTIRAKKIVVSDLTYKMSCGHTRCPAGIQDKAFIYILNEKQTKNSMSAWATLKSVFNLVEVAVVDNYLYVNILVVR